MPSRRRVAVVFCDLVDSTRIMSALGDIANDELRRDYFAALRRSIEACGGDEVKSQGDGMMVVFDTPPAAVQCATEMQRAMARLGDRDLPLELRAGVSWGEATAEEGDWFGTPVVEAARLCAKARPGQVLVTDVVRRHGATDAAGAGRAPGLESASEEGLVELKGLTDPRRVWSVPWSIDEHGGLPVPPGLQRPVDRELVGRDAELATLRGIWAEVATGATRTVIVHGEAGAGSTRLVAELVAEVVTGTRVDAEGDTDADDHPLVLHGRAAEGGDGREALEEALRWYVTSATRDEVREATRGLRPELDGVLPSLTARLGPPSFPVDSKPDPAPDPGLVESHGHELRGNGRAGRLHADLEPAERVLLELLGRLTDQRTVVLAIDEGHHLGPVGVALVEEITFSRWCAGLLLVVMGRTEAGSTADRLDRLDRLRDKIGDAAEVTDLPVGPLPHDAVADLLGLDGTSEAANVAFAETGGVAAHVTALKRQLQESGAGSDSTVDEVHRAIARTAPYKGLAVFRSEDRDLFHGRDALSDLILERLSSRRLVVLIGRSGSGKSSLVRAGVLPSLADGALPGSAGWGQVTVAPGRSPTETLDAVLATDRSCDVLFIDQMEELFAADVDLEEATRFCRRLLRADDAAPVRVIATLRADVVGAATAVPGLAAALDGATVLVPPMSEPDLRAAIERPAATLGLHLEPGLTELVLADVADRPGALPLLSHAMYETWRHRRGNTLRAAAYREVGGVDGAVARTADAVFLDQLDHDEQRIARAVMVELVEPGDGVEDGRRAVPRPELEELDDSGGSAATTVIEKLVEARLLSVDGDRVELTHEALIRAWPRLRGWLDDDRAEILRHRRLSRATAEWIAAGRAETELYRGERLTSALGLLARRGPHVTPDEREFLDASVALRDRERALAEERAAHDRRANRRLRALLVASGVGLILAIVAAVVAVGQRNETRRLAAATDARAAAGSVPELLTDDVTLARLVAAEAHALASSGETEGALLAADLTDGRRTFVQRLRVEQPRLGIDAESESIVATDGRTIARFDLDDGHELGSVELPESDSAIGIAPDAMAVVVSRREADDSLTLVVVDPEGTELWSRPLPALEIAVTQPDIDTIAVSAGGRYVVTRDPASSVVWINSAEDRISFAPPEGAVLDFGIDPSGERVAITSQTGGSAMTATGDGAAAVTIEDPLTTVDAPDATAIEPSTFHISLLDIGTGETTRTWTAASPPLDPQFSPDGRQLAISLGASVEDFVSVGATTLPATARPTVAVLSAEQDAPTGRPRAGQLLGWVGDDVAILDGSWLTTWSADLQTAADIPYLADDQDDDVAIVSTPVAVTGDPTRLVLVQGRAAGWRLSVWDRTADHGILTDSIGPTDASEIVVLGDDRALVVTDGTDDPDDDGRPQPATSLVDLSDGRVVARVHGTYEGSANNGTVLIDGTLHRTSDLTPVDDRALAGAPASRLLSSDGRMALALDGSTIRRIDLSDGEILTPSLELDDDPGHITFSGDGSRYAVMTQASEIILVDASTGRALPQDLDGVVGRGLVALDHSGSLLAVGEASGRVWLDREGSGDLGRPLNTTAGDDEVTSIRFIEAPGRDAPLLVVTDASSTTTIYDTASLTPISEPIHLPIRAVSTSTDTSGTIWLATTTGLGAVSLHPDDWWEAACRSAGRQLTEDESATYFPGRGRLTACDR